MSQSPVENLGADAALRYRQGWRALNRLLHENRSFSGNEKHCAFLNCGPDGQGNARAFADVSSAIGFDLPDDGRALAVVDWDFDGDLDVWTTSRNAPRVRLLRNASKGHHFVAFLLEGDGKATNREAIGARLELHVAGEPVPRIKTLHAGHSFLSQSSRWVHFGLGSKTELEKLVVRWPGGAREEIRGLVADRFHRVIQGRGTPERWLPPEKRIELEVAAPELPASGQAARVLVPAGMRLPTLWTRTQEGAARFERKRQGPLLVNLWASYCLPCAEELAEWAEAAPDFRKAGIEVIALNTDALSGAERATDNARSMIAKTGFPFPWAEADLLTVRNLDAFSNAVLDLWLPLPVPSSFLVDAQGEVLVIYKGPVKAAQVVEDARLAGASMADRREASVVFPGRWVGEAMPGDSLRVASQLLNRDEGASAVRYLEELVLSLEPRAADTAARRDLGDALRFLGVLLEQSGKLAEAGRHLGQARDLIPDDIRIRTTLASVLRKLGDLREATSELTAAIRINPSDLSLHGELADLYAEQGLHKLAVERYGMILKLEPKRARARLRMAESMLASGQGADAVANLKRTLSTDPSLLEAANLLARVLSSHPDRELRAPREALALAARLRGLSKNKDPRFLDTYAVAAAANGQFDEAVRFAESALALYKAHPRYASEQMRVTEALGLFRKRQPWRDSRWK